ncbi:MAG: mechanosensitive ion channel [Hyphomicrobiales bacterium]|nr:mechanosensitive ion channel [Hyphomicrobiales bacterium]
MGRYFAILLLPFFLAQSLSAKEAPATSSDASAMPPQVRVFVGLMDDPQVRAWLSKQIEEKQVEGKLAPVAAPNKPDGELNAFAAHFDLIRAHFAALIQVIPSLPEQFGQAAKIAQGEMEQHSFGRAFLLLALFIGLGFALEWLFWRATARLRARIDLLTLDTVQQRLLAVGMRFALGIGGLISFALGSICAFLAFEWPSFLKQLVLGYLAAFLALRFTLGIARFLLAPGGHTPGDETRFRILPMTTRAARYWTRRLALIVGWFSFGWVTVLALAQFGFTKEAVQLFAYGLGLVLLGLGIEAVWHAPRMANVGTGEPSGENQQGRARAVGLSLYFALLWLLWVAGAWATFWAAVVLAALPAAVKLTDRAVGHLLRPPGQEEAKVGVPTLAVICLERGLRGILIIGALLWLAHVWSVDIGDIATQNTLVTRVMRAILTAVIVILIADFAWSVARTFIDTRIEEANSVGEVPIEEQRRRARLRTLLPIVRVALFVFILTLGGMMGLASLGIQIGPLIASAGVVGVAVGFGAQTLVRDIFSGIFYLLDDAFRIGEYIQSGNYRGEVEGFSLRSVKLRHQNGPLYTVPFGVLGAVQNMSRDWVVTKLDIGVTYDSDIEKARKIVKKVGEELAREPELAAGILEPLKMQGVEALGDFAVQLRLKMKTRPGDVQFIARRQALGLIKNAFDKNGIKFAYPTVQVAGVSPGASDEAVSASVAQKGLELVKPAKGV